MKPSSGINKRSSSSPRDGAFFIRFSSYILIIIIATRLWETLSLSLSTTSNLPQSHQRAAACHNYRNPVMLSEYEKDGINQIPLRLHQVANESLSNAFKKNRKSWIDNHFEWDSKLWSVEEMDKLVKYEFIWAWPAYSAQKSFHDKLYIGKLLILYMYGGVYADLELQSIRNSIRINKWGGLVFPLVNTSQASSSVDVPTSIKYSVSNSYMASERGHPFFLFAVQSITDLWTNHKQKPGRDYMVGLIQDFEAQRLPSDPPIIYLDPGYFVLNNVNKPLPLECMESTIYYDKNTCQEKVITPKTLAIAYNTPYDLSM